METHDEGDAEENESMERNRERMKGRERVCFIYTERGGWDERGEKIILGQDEKRERVKDKGEREKEAWENNEKKG